MKREDKKMSIVCAASFLAQSSKNLSQGKGKKEKKSERKNSKP